MHVNLAYSAGSLLLKNAELFNFKVLIKSRRYEHFLDFLMGINLDSFKNT